jgi:uridine phosphorylase
MESSAIAGLSKLMGHKAMTVCVIIANRLAGNSNTAYGGSVENLIETVLDRI